MSKDFFKEYKPEIIRVRLSTPIMVRTRCKHCMGLPSIYYYLRNPTMWFSPRKALDASSHIKKLIGLIQQRSPILPPKYYTSASLLAHNIMYAKYRPKLHRTRGCSAVFDVVEILTCDCMQTTWAFTDKAVSNRPEIACRKARYRFPNKFSF